MFDVHFRGGAGQISHDGYETVRALESENVKYANALSGSCDMTAAFKALPSATSGTATHCCDCNVYRGDDLSVRCVFSSRSPVPHSAVQLRQTPRCAWCVLPLSGGPVSILPRVAISRPVQHSSSRPACLAHAHAAPSLFLSPSPHRAPSSPLLGTSEHSWPLC